MRVRRREGRNDRRPVRWPVVLVAAVGHVVICGLLSVCIGMVGKGSVLGLVPQPVSLGG